MLYNRCTGIYKFGNNTYPRRIRRRSNLGASYGPGNTVCVFYTELCDILPDYENVRFKTFS